MKQRQDPDYRFGRERASPRPRFREVVSESGGGYYEIAPFLLLTSHCGKHTQREKRNKPSVTITQLQHSTVPLFHLLPPLFLSSGMF